MSLIIMKTLCTAFNLMSFDMMFGCKSFATQFTVNSLHSNMDHQVVSAEAGGFGEHFPALFTFEGFDVTFMTPPLMPPQMLSLFKTLSTRVTFMRLLSSMGHIVTF